MARTTRADVPRLLARYHEEAGRKIIFAERTRRSESWTFVLFYRCLQGAAPAPGRDGSSGRQLQRDSSDSAGKPDRCLGILEPLRGGRGEVEAAVRDRADPPSPSPGRPISDGLRPAGGARPQRHLGLRRYHRGPAAGSDTGPDRPDDRWACRHGLLPGGDRPAHPWLGVEHVRHFDRDPCSRR